MAKYTLSLHHPEGRTDLIEAATLRDLVVSMRSLATYVHYFDRLQGAVAAGVPTPSRLCPLHRVPFMLYKFGWAHLPVNAGESWCKEAEMKPIAAAPTPAN